MSDASSEWDQVWEQMRSRPNAALVAAEFSSMDKARDVVSRLAYLENTGGDTPVISMPNGIIGQAFPTNNGPVIFLLGGSLSVKQFEEAVEVCRKLGEIIDSVAPTKPWWKFW